MALKLVSDGGGEAEEPTLNDYRDQIDGCRFDIEHIASLLDMLGEKCSPNDLSEESAAWLRVQFLAKVLQERAAQLATAAEGIEVLEMRRRRDEKGDAAS